MISRKGYRSQIADTVINKSIVINGNSSVANNLIVDTDTLYVSSGTDKVGVNTTNPNKELTVVGDIAATGIITADTQLWSPLINTDEINTGTFNATGDINIDSNTLFVNSSLNRVGIGTNIPTTPLEVNGDLTTGDIKFRNTTNSIFFSNTTTQQEIVGSGNDLVCFTTATERMRIKNTTGFVGIGTANPVSLLHLSTGSVSTTTCGLTIEADTTNTASETTTPFINLLTDGGATNTTIGIDSSNVLNIGNSTTTNLGGGVAIRTNVNGSSIERMIITGSGNVGIGTTNPTKPLEVNGEIKCSSLTQTNRTYSVGETIKSTYLTVIDSETTKPYGSIGTTILTEGTETTPWYSIFGSTYTPSSDNSYIVVEFDIYYYINAWGNDNYQSRILVNGTTQLSLKYHRNESSDGGGGRSGVLTPITARYTNTSLTDKTFTLEFRRIVGNDAVVIDLTLNSIMKIHEIQR